MGDFHLARLARLAHFAGLWRCLLMVFVGFVGFTSLDVALAMDTPLLLDKGWRFHQGDLPLSPAVGHEQTYLQMKAGYAGGPAGIDFDDSNWRTLDLPHDWAVEGPFDPSANMDQGYRPRGLAWYRRYLRVDAAQRGRHIELQFDGIASQAEIWFNGHLLHRSFSGYTANHLDLTPYLRFGDEINTIAVRVNAEAMEGWWYEGAGIYRHVWLSQTDALHLHTDGLHLTPMPTPTPLKNAPAKDRWRLPMAVSLANDGPAPASATLEVTLLDPTGRQVEQRRAELHVAAQSSLETALPIDVTAPQRWSVDHPQLYQVHLRLLRQGQVLEHRSWHTGFRTLKFDAQQGFFLNGLPLKIKGVCIHQDHAGVGVAVPQSIWAYRLKRLKAMGANAVRFAHNAPPPEALDLADQLGLMVMDENRHFGADPETLQQLRWLVRRDRHHPSVILWSLFNEEPLQGGETGYEIARRMTAAVKALDTTRPVTAAMNGGFFSDLNASHALDVIGLNYQHTDYDRLHAERPQTPLISTEDASAFMTRGVYAPSHDPDRIPADDEHAADWGLNHRASWTMLAERPFMAGGFAWTGFDYRGEPTPQSWPAVSSMFGIMDLAGFAKSAFYIRQAQWREDRPVLHIEPHWSWPGQAGQMIPVMVMSNAQRVVLRLNGQPIGTQHLDRPGVARFDVPYAPGLLEAVGYDHEHEVSRDAVETTGPGVSLALQADRPALAGDGQDAVPVTLWVRDAQGRAVPDAQTRVHIEVRGAGRSLGHGNGDPLSHEDEKGAHRSLFHGLAQVIVQSHFTTTPGEIEIEAQAEGLAPAVLKLPVKASRLGTDPAALLDHALPAAFAPEQDPPATRLTEWRTSPLTSRPPGPPQPLADQDMNTWGWGAPPMTRAASAQATWQQYRTRFTPRNDVADGRGVLAFAAIQGRAEVWLDGQWLGRKTDPAPQALTLPLPAGAVLRELRVVIQSDAGMAGGIIGAVQLLKAPTGPSVPP
ncbi:beta-galactosidase GalA [Roseateles koreensis]|uniref:Glycoside hydrolase family 2 TIM barrel-domain containing protein n=1 Tax=Roseateles koreensis TaxID=2987526 RepID=A0ABT5KMK4_9BURK|nr:beta-galactosidase GalA [Roseateles koreensis]MDC8783608.1 glycoside hydrolase family 2 TIM barrel-domain containing protein [Roseateles koreensis]